MSFLSSLLNIFTSFTVNILDGFPYLPITQINPGSIFSKMTNAVNYVDSSGNFFLGQPYTGSSSLSKPSFQQAPIYTPGTTTPPVAFPTAQPNGYVVPIGVNLASVYNTSSEGVRHIKYFEGLHQRPYIINGQTYIGYGHQITTGSMTYVSSDQADSFLATDISAAEGVVKGAVSGKLTQTQFDALVDFAFTMPAGTFTSSNVISSFNGGDIAGACTALANWSYGMQNGVVVRLAHLLARRTGNVHWMTHSATVQPPV